MTRRRFSPKVYLNPASVWELLDQHNMCQNELAQLSGISPRSPSRLMSQTPRPRLICGGGGARPLGVTDFDDLFIVRYGDD